jgi:hypothetical protein
MTVFTAAASYLLPLLTDVAVRQRSILTPDEALGETVTWEDSDPLPCLLDQTPALAAESVAAGALRSVERWQVAFALGTDILPADRLVINGGTYEVTGTNAGQTTAALLAADIVRVL